MEVGTTDVYLIAKQMKRENQDILGDNCLRNDKGNLAISDGTAVLEQVLWDTVDMMQFGFMPGRGTIDPIFIVHQIQGKHLTNDRNLYLAFIGLKKAFDCVPHEVLWWVIRYLGFPEWLVRTIQAMYANARSRVHLNNSYS